MHYFRKQWLKQKIITQIKLQNIGKLLQVTVAGYFAVGSN